MNYICRKITKQMRAVLDRGKSILLLGARQTGKTTSVLEEIKPDITYSFVDPEIRLRYEKDPSLLTRELEQRLSSETPLTNMPIIFIMVSTTFIERCSPFTKIFS